MKKYDIFISYRREGGFETADSINQRLQKAGYSVFLDLEQLNSGKFNEKLLEVIEGCEDFILVLPPNALNRCNDPQDWVRREVEHAIAKGKNIVPIMLRGFEWPDENSLPETLRDLSLYNGITASDHNLFEENIERLKHKFLKSKPGFTWRRYKKYILSVMAVLLACVGYIIYSKYTEKDNYDKLSQEYAMAMMTEFVKAHENYAMYESLIRDWKTYASECEKGKQETACQDFMASVDNYSKDLYQPKDVVFTEEYLKMLRDRGVEAEDFQAFNMACALEYDNVTTAFERMTLYTAMDYDSSFTEQINFIYDFNKLSLKSNYCCLLYLYAQMDLSDTAWEKLGKAISDLRYMSDVPIRLSAQEYEVMTYSIINDMEDKRNKVEWILLDQEKKLKQLEQHDAALVDSLAQVERVADLVDECVEKTLEYTQIEIEMAEKYNDAMAKFSLKSSDDQGTMWGKILRMAKLAETSRQWEVEDMTRYKKNVAEAKKKGVNPDHLSKPVYLIPSSQKFDVVDQMLAQYQSFNPANESTINQYVASARVFFKEVSQGKVASDVGILMIGTDGGRKHPAYEVGDIIIERNGMTIRNTSDYVKSGQGKSQNQVVVLRKSGSGLKKTTISFPSDCPVTIGAFELHED